MGEKQYRSSTRRVGQVVEHAEVLNGERVGKRSRRQQGSQLSNYIKAVLCWYRPQ